MHQDNPIYHTERIEQQLEKIIYRIAAKENRTIAATKKKYESRYAVAKSFIEHLRKKHGNHFKVIPGTKEHTRLVQILSGLTDKSGKLTKNGRQLWKSLPFFRTLNAHNASTHVYNHARMKELVELLGVEELYSEEDFLGLTEELIFHTALPTSGSMRGVQTNAGRGKIHKVRG